ncbi:MAG: ATP-binding protein [Bacteroidales bacterium]|nr:ATP-binding protein [Bacteroidales bacterium]
MVYIRDIVIDTMWGDTSLEWRGLDPHINIVVGQNGFGKTTMLNLIRAVLMKDDKFIRQLKAKVHINTLITNKDTGESSEGEMYFDGKQVIQKPTFGGYDSQSCFYYVNTFDVPASKKSSLSQLGLTLDQVLYQRNPDVFSFSDYRLSMLKDLRAAMHMQERIDKFFDLINSLFLMTGKTIDIDDKNRVIFRKGRQIIDMEKLSAGEKQILLLLFTLFLMEDRSTVLLLDEPEISLHIEWQDRLIQLMLDLNPNCQIIMTTHSPNIFADGWEDKLVFISDLVRV